MAFTLEGFVFQSNRIEGILRNPTEDEILAHRDFLELGEKDVTDLKRFVWVVANAPLRREFGMNVRVGRHIAPEGGPGIERDLADLLREARFSKHLDAYHVHRKYETLHPFMDGNGRSGRVLWLWMIGGRKNAPLGFLHHFYYQALEAGG